MSGEAFKQDCIEIAVEQYAKGRISRRDFVAALGALGVLPMVGAQDASAQAKEFVLANWGGDAVKAMDEAFGQSFAKDKGVKFVIDSSGPSLGKIKAMVESRNVTWDVCDSGAGTSFDLGRQGLLEPIDYAIVDKKTMPEAFALPWGAAASAFSNVLAYDTAKVGANPPKNWADLWDVKKYPGKRTMWKNMFTVLETALMADGVAPDKVYPIDVKRAFAKVKELKPHVNFWNSGAESQQMLRDGEVVMGNVWNTRAKIVEQDTKGRVTWTWEQGIINPGIWVIPKGNPAGKLAQDFIQSTMAPERQIVLLRTLGSGPANAAASALVPEELKRTNPTYGPNAAKQIYINAFWYADHYTKTYQDFLDLISS
ncbi:MAG: ABC transporter substrate-binding protein [Alphaproteobacteria bacterium]|nr:ABC transporter substrate-binding protein [Alphaproteobacteria bacterium]